MEETTLRNLMILIAVATPLLAGMIYGVTRRVAEDGRPAPRRMRRNLWILAAAGPVNLVLWLLLNGWLDRMENRSAIGYVLAAIVFIAVGFTTGWFGGRRRADRPEDGEDDAK